MGKRKPAQVEGYVVDSLLGSLAESLDRIGMVQRGGFHPQDDDSVPFYSAQRPTGTVLLIGNAGSPMWSVFCAHRRRQPELTLDQFTQGQINRIATAIGARAVFPFGGPPYHPFQRWARRSEPVFSSPLKMLVHPVYGLWHAYRAALLLAEIIELPEHQTGPSPCETCLDQPCLTACPVNAFDGQEYNTQACVDLVANGERAAGNTCRDHACQARLACPVGRAFTYTAPHGRFHMAAFVQAQKR